MKTLDNIMHAISIVRGETLRGILISPRFFVVFKYKNYFYSFRYVSKYMRKIVDLCFYFLLKKKIMKLPFFWVLDKETPLTELIHILQYKIE